jgi:hypothetical protein
LPTEIKEELAKMPVLTFTSGTEQKLSWVLTVKKAKAPACTFGIPANFDKVTSDDLKAMSGGGN